MNLRKLYKRYFKKGNVCVTGLRGCGKDMLFANVVARNTKQYISNIDYNTKSQYFAFCPSALRIGSDYEDFINETCKPFNYDYPLKADYYLSDIGVYFPSQYNGELNKKYKDIPVFMALSRHIAECNVHINVQNLNRAWDKIREQSDTYIRCNWCKVLFGKVVIQNITVYDKYDSCLNRVEPFRPLRPPLLSHGTNRGQYQVKNEELLRGFKERNGFVRKYTLIYINKSKYDTLQFRKILGVQYA